MNTIKIQFSELPQDDNKFSMRICHNQHCTWTGYSLLDVMLPHFYPPQMGPQEEEEKEA